MKARTPASAQPEDLFRAPRTTIFRWLSRPHWITARLGRPIGHTHLQFRPAARCQYDAGAEYAHGCDGEQRLHGEQLHVTPPASYGRYAGSRGLVVGFAHGRGVATHGQTRGTGDRRVCGRCERRPESVCVCHLEYGSCGAGAVERRQCSAELQEMGRAGVQLDRFRRSGTIDHPDGRVPELSGTSADTIRRVDQLRRGHAAVSSDLRVPVGERSGAGSKRTGKPGRGLVLVHQQRPVGSDAVVDAARHSGILEPVRYLGLVRLVQRVVSDVHEPGQEARAPLDHRLCVLPVGMPGGGTPGPGRQFSARQFTITTSPPAPVLASGSLANGATYDSGGLVPGSWAQVKGTGLSPVSRTWGLRIFRGWATNCRHL